MPGATLGITHILYSISDPTPLRETTFNYNVILRLSYDCEFDCLLFDHLVCMIMYT